jgi:uncharacterized membrane protein
MKIRLPLKPGMNRGYLLVALVVICFFSTVLRHILTGRTTYYFLNWNLLLAAIPWFISLAISSKFVIKKPKILTVVLFIFWLLFFPNAPYIITDLYYLRNHAERTFWYDSIMILAFAWTGLLFGFFSLDTIKGLWDKKLSMVKSIIIICSLLFVCAFGIYLGRDLRWNSWEIFIEPGKLVLDVIDRFINPIQHRRGWSFIFLIWIFLNITYWTFNIIQKDDNHHKDDPV